MRAIALNGKAGRGRFALVDNLDYDRVMRVSSNWYLLQDRNMEYAITKVKVNNRGKQAWTTILMHLVILGRSDNGRVTHHINAFGLDNRRTNLCFCTRSQHQGRERMRGGTSKFRGVSWSKSAKKWRSHIKLNGQQRHLGYFTSETAAAKAYDEAAQELFGKFARLNEFGVRDERETTTVLKRGSKRWCLWVCVSRKTESIELSPVQPGDSGTPVAR